MLKDQYNAYENVLQNYLNNSGGKVVPRIFLDIVLLSEEAINLAFHVPEGVEPPPVFQKFLGMKFEECRDILDTHFELRKDSDDKSSYLEVDTSFYSDLPVNEEVTMIIRYSEIISEANGSLFYYEFDRGALWAFGSICSYQGGFELPRNIETQNIWKS